MRHILKASFELQSDAQHLMEELSAAGFTGAALALSGATHAGPFTHRRPAVTLAVDSEPEATRALGIMERCNPARLQDDPAGDDPDGAEPEASAAEPDVGLTVPVFPPGAQPGALQFRHLDDGRYFGTQNAAAPPAGNTFQETMGTASDWNGADEYTLQQAVAVPWPKIDDDHDRSLETASPDPTPPAMDDSAAQRNAADRTAHHAGWGAAWSRVKEALHHGWDRGKS